MRLGFRFRGQLPAILSLSPSSGSPGDSIVITGLNFNSVQSVDFNGIAATSFTRNSSTQITATAPSGFATGPIHVTNLTGTASSSNFTRLAPTITSISPLTGNTGDSVVITGTNFYDVSAVDFNGAAAASFVRNSPTQVTAVVSASATVGLVHVTTPGGTAASGQTFTPTLFMDMTSGVPAQLTPTARTGGNLWLGRGASAPVAQAAGSQGIFDDRGGLVKGIWTCPGYGSDLTSPNDLTAAAWTKQNVTATAGIADPTGGTSASRLSDMSAVNRGLCFQQAAGSANRVHSHWVKNGPSAPTVDGGILADGSGGYGLSNASTGSWKRVSGWGFGVLYHAKIPNGYTPGTHAGNPAVVFTDTATGEVDVWGSSSIQTTVDYPGVDGSTSAQDYRLLNSADLARVITGGDLDVEFRIWSTHQSLGVSAYPNGHVCSMESPDGKIEVHFNNPNFTFICRGVTLGTIQMAGFSTGMNLHIKFQYKPSVGKWRARVGLNGCYQPDISGNTTGGALNAVTSFYLGSNVGANYGSWLFESVSFPTGQAVAKFSPEASFHGDSIMGSYVNMAISGCGFYDKATTEYKTRPGLLNMSVGGDSIDGQTAKWNASEYNTSTSILEAFFMVGANDLINQLDSEATMRTQYNALTAAIKATLPAVKVASMKMSPFAASLNAGQLTSYHNLNISLLGGASPITNCDDRISSHFAVLDNGTENLRTEMSFDGLHPTDNGRFLAMGASMRASFHAFGFI